MSFPDLPTRRVPREGSTAIGHLFTAEIDGTTSTALQIGYGAARPVTNFGSWPGPAKPTTPGSYLVMITDGTEYEAIGWLVVF